MPQEVAHSEFHRPVLLKGIQVFSIFAPIYCIPVIVGQFGNCTYSLCEVQLAAGC